MPSADETAPISGDTRRLVWHRDGGRCRGCGAASDLQFDHIIPRSLGGSGRAENVEVLCGPCNRMKGVRVAHQEGRRG
jgi:5-methylcytosine-specific restriction endonuclease McrA